MNSYAQMFLRHIADFIWRRMDCIFSVKQNFKTDFIVSVTNLIPERILKSSYFRLLFYYTLFPVILYDEILSGTCIFKGFMLEYYRFVTTATSGLYRFRRGFGSCSSHSGGSVINRNLNIIAEDNLAYAA